MDRCDNYRKVGHKFYLLASTEPKPDWLEQICP